MKPLLMGWTLLPPSENAKKGINTNPSGFTKSGRRKRAEVFLRPEVVEWKKDAITSLYTAWHDVERIEQVRTNKHARLYLSITAYLPANRLEVRDDDNFLKMPRDTIFRDYLQINDVRIFDTHVSKRLAPLSVQPCLYISIYEMDSEEITYESDDARHLALQHNTVSIPRTIGPVTESTEHATTRTLPRKHAASRGRRTA